MSFAEEGRGVVNSGRKPDFGGLADLALVTCLNVPLDVRVERRPPEAVEKGAARGIEALVAKPVVGVADERVSYGRAGVELVPAVVLLLPKASPGNEEAVCSANKTGQRIGG